jgi:hypothetical protein
VTFFKKLLCGCLVAALADLPAYALQAPLVPPIAGSSACNLQSGAAAANAGVSPRAFCSMDPQFGAYGDAQQMWGNTLITTGTNALTVGTAQTISATVTAIAGANNITTSASVFPSAGTSRNNLIGQPISITGVGKNGATFNSTIVTVVNNTQIAFADPLPTAVTASAQTIVIGAYFNSADVGKAIVVPGAGAAACPMLVGRGQNVSNCLITSIASYVSANSVTLAANATATLSTGNTNAWQQIVWGHDDSAALSAAILAAIARGDRYLYVPGNHYVPSMSALAAYVIPYGEGKFFAAPMRRYVIPSNAPQAAPPSSDISPLMLANTKAAGSPVNVVIGDSIWQNANDPSNEMQPWTYFQAVLTWRNPSKSMANYNRAIGAQSWVNADTVPSAFPSWDANHSTPWLGSPAASGYVYALNPTLLLMGFQNNDGTGFSISSFLDAQSKISTWASQPDRIFATHWTKTIFQTGINAPDAGDYAAMFLRTYARAMGYGLIDFNRQGDKLRDGFDPLANAMVLSPAYNDFANARLNLPYTSPISTTGYSVALNDVTGQSGPSFWSHYGNEIQFSLSAGSGNLFRMGYDSAADATGNIGSGNLYYQCDISASYPGAGCAGGTKPSILTNVSIASGSNSLTTSAAIFTTADNCVWMTVPGAGSSGGQFVAYGKYISTTNVTFFSDAGCTTARNANTTLSASNQVILRGNPKIQTGINVSSDATNSTSFGVSISGDIVNLFYQNAEHAPFFSGAAVRFGGPFVPAITATTNFPLGVSIFGSTNEAFFVETPQLTWPSLMDADVNGPTSDTPVNNPSYIGAFGGAGDNHGTSKAMGLIVRPVIDAAGLAAQ